MPERRRSLAEPLLQESIACYASCGAKVLMLMGGAFAVVLSLVLCIFGGGGQHVTVQQPAITMLNAQLGFRPVNLQLGLRSVPQLGPLQATSGRQTQVRSFFGFGKKDPAEEATRDEMIKEQQRMLEARRQGKAIKPTKRPRKKTEQELRQEAKKKYRTPWDESPDEDGWVDEPKKDQGAESPVGKFFKNFR